ncbi:MAG: MmcQ/YjbR family DNA-binding protein [Bacteroidetes bacterium]|jgi:hypothetical protein|nr:MmcQ/YjbR family DNA-binding protein [Bacteroidota bacterium]
MVSFENYKELALSLPESEEYPHFDKISFRVKKKIFATYDATKDLACVKLTALEQSVFAYDEKIIYPIPNAWGKQGWTYIDLKKVRKTVLKDVLKTAYCNVAPKKMLEQLQIKKP